MTRYPSILPLVDYMVRSVYLMQIPAKHLLFYSFKDQDLRIEMVTIP